MPIVVASAVDQVPATDATSPDGLLRAEVLDDFAGVRLTVDYRSLFTDDFDWPNPFRATVYRVNPDGSKIVVRSADDRSQYGGKYTAYDDEVSFGTTYQYYVEAMVQDGSLGRRSFSVAVLTWAPDGGDTMPGVWMKSLDNPMLSRPVRTNDWSTWAYASRSDVSDVMGSKYSAVNQRARGAGTTSLQVLTKTGDEYTGLLDLLSDGVLFIASWYRPWQRDGYYVIEDISPARPTDLVKHGFDYWTIAARRVDRPTTSNQNYPTVPWRSLADLKSEYATLGQLGESYATLNDLVREL